MLKYKKNNKKICDTSDHSFKNVPVVARYHFKDRFLYYTMVALSQNVENCIIGFCKQTFISIMPYADKREQLLKMIFLVNEQTVFVVYFEINAISLCQISISISTIFQKDECFCSKLGLILEHSKPKNLKT